MKLLSIPELDFFFLSAEKNGSMEDVVNVVVVDFGGCGGSCCGCGGCGGSGCWD